MDLNFIPYGRQTITEEDIEAVVDVLQSPFLTQGPAVPSFEQAVATEVGAEYAVAVNSATSALHIACLALSLGPGDYLWTSPITFVASANCARYCGAYVDFVDIDPSTGLMSTQALSKKLYFAAKKGTLPKIIIPVHLCGSSCDMKAIHQLAKQYNISIIEDASHAIGGSYHDVPVGSCQYSDITVFSFHPVKIITTGEGGCALTNNAQIAASLRQLRSHGITKDHRNFVLDVSAPWAYEQQVLGFNYRMNDLQGALGLSQIRRLKKNIIDRNNIFKSYLAKTKHLPLRFLAIPSNVRSSLHLAVIRLSNQDSSYHLNIFKSLRAANIGVQLHYSPVHLQPYYQTLGFIKGDFPNAEAYATNAITLPIFPQLSTCSQDYIVKILEELLLNDC